jgi:flagellar assembly protein FliH
VSQISTPAVIPVISHHETEQKSDNQPDTETTMAEDQTDQDNSVEAMHAANELMKEAIKASQEIKEKSQETGYQEGFSQGYATGHEEGLKDGNRDGFQVGLREGLNEGMTQATSEIEQKLQEIHELLDAINEERQQALDNREKELLDIAFEIA